MLDNEHAIINLKRGSQLAFNQIYIEYHEQLYAFAYKYLQSKALSEDAIQILFLTLWENRAKLNPHLTLKSYLFTILKNNVLNHIRDYKSHSEKNFEYIQEQPDSILDAIEEKPIETMSALLKEAINTLPKAKRAICILKIEEELNNEEIADKLNISVNTVKFQYSQSIKILKKILGNSFPLFIPLLFNM